MVGDAVWYSLERDTGKHLPFVELLKARQLPLVAGFIKRLNVFLRTHRVVFGGHRVSPGIYLEKLSTMHWDMLWLWVLTTFSPPCEISIRKTLLSSWFQRFSLLGLAFGGPWQCRCRS